MKKIYSEQLFAMENGENFLINVTVEDGEVTDITAAEDIEYKNYSFKKGELINCDGDESMIRSEDVLIGFLQEE